MQVNDAMKELGALHKEHIKDYEENLDKALISFRKIQRAEQQLKELSLNAYKVYDNMEIPENIWNTILNSISSIKSIEG